MGRCFATARTPKIVMGRPLWDNSVNFKPLITANQISFTASMVVSAIPAFRTFLSIARSTVSCVSGSSRFRIFPFTGALESHAPAIQTILVNTVNTNDLPCRISVVN